MSGDCFWGDLRFSVGGEWDRGTQLVLTVQVSTFVKKGLVVVVSTNLYKSDDYFLKNSLHFSQPVKRFSNMTIAMCSSLLKTGSGPGCHLAHIDW